MSAGIDAKVPIVKIVIGGMHSAAVSTAGVVYTWGCNDEGALGREGIEG